MYTAAVEFSHNSVNGEHTVLVNLEIKGDKVQAMQMKMIIK